MYYAPEKISIKFIGTIRTSNGNRLNVFSTVSRKHVSMYPLTPSGRMKVKGIPVKVHGLAPKLRRRLGC
jgi:hypothetical protein